MVSNMSKSWAPLESGRPLVVKAVFAAAAKEDEARDAVSDATSLSVVVLCVVLCGWLLWAGLNPKSPKATAASSLERPPPPVVVLWAAREDAANPFPLEKALLLVLVVAVSDLAACGARKASIRDPLPLTPWACLEII